MQKKIDALASRQPQKCGARHMCFKQLPDERKSLGFDDSRKAFTYMQAPMVAHPPQFKNLAPLEVHRLERMAALFVEQQRRSFQAERVILERRLHEFNAQQTTTRQQRGTFVRKVCPNFDVVGEAAKTGPSEIVPFSFPMLVPFLQRF